MTINVFTRGFLWQGDVQIKGSHQLDKYKPFGNKISFIACKKNLYCPFLRKGFYTKNSKNIYFFNMHLIIKSDNIRWLKNVVRNQKQFLKLKFNQPFMIYRIHVFTWTRVSHKLWTVVRISVFKTVLESLHHFKLSLSLFMIRHILQKKKEF